MKRSGTPCFLLNLDGYMQGRSAAKKDFIPPFSLEGLDGMGRAYYPAEDSIKKLQIVGKAPLKGIIPNFIIRIYAVKQLYDGVYKF